MVAALALLIAGIVLLTGGADRMVVAAARLSRMLGISPVLVGAVIVGAGTSAPELLVSGLAAGRGELDLAIGNIVGSNVANVTLVLGAGAVMVVIRAAPSLMRREGLLMLAGVTLFAVLVADFRLERWEGALLAVLMVVAAVFLTRWSAGHEPSALGEVPTTPRLTVLVGLASLAVTLVGAELLVRGAERLVAAADISSAFVGLVVVAIGTSLPELATSIAAARRNETDLMIGNVVGSNLFNSLAVGGLAGLVGPDLIAESFRGPLVVMVLTAVVAGAFVATGNRLVRSEGVLLLGAFVAFLVVAA